MNERMITIPYKEYLELQTYKEIANSDDERVYIKEEAESLGNFYSWWFVYTKDQAVRDLSDKLNEARKQLKKSRERCKSLEEGNEKTSNIVINILLFCIMVALIYLIFNINYI